MNRPSELFHHDGAVPARFTAAEFLRMAEVGAFEDMKVELDHGELVRMNPPYTAHAAAQMRIGVALVEAFRNVRATVVGEVTVVLTKETVRAFDAAVVTAEGMNESTLRPEHVLIGIEISDTTLDVDLGRKLRDYAGAGIPNYWVIDVNARVIHVMGEPVGAEYKKRGLIRFGEPLAVPGTNQSITIG